MVNTTNFTIRTLENANRNIAIAVAAFFIPFTVVMCCFFGFSQPNVTAGIVAGCIEIASTIIALRYVSRSIITIKVDHNGITKTKDGQSITIHWQEPHELWYDATELWYTVIPIGTTIQTRITTPDGRCIQVELAQIKHQNTIFYYNQLHILPYLQKQLNVGKTLHFGPVILDKHFIKINEEDYSLYELEKTDIEQGFLKLKLRDQWFSTKIRLKDIPNFSSLYSLINQGTDNPYFMTGLATLKS